MVVLQAQAVKAKTPRVFLPVFRLFSCTAHLAVVLRSEVIDEIVYSGCHCICLYLLLMYVGEVEISPTSLSGIYWREG